MSNTTKKKVLILGGGPNRIGQGIEFDYCCCHASFALKEEGACWPDLCVPEASLGGTGGGPNRIGQGIEFDYCCCHASFALKEEGVESVMINCNPETVSMPENLRYLTKIIDDHGQGRIRSA